MRPTLAGQALAVGPSLSVFRGPSPCRRGARCPPRGCLRPRCPRLKVPVAKFFRKPCVNRGFPTRLKQKARFCCRPSDKKSRKLSLFLVFLARVVRLGTGGRQLVIVEWFVWVSQRADKPNVAVCPHTSPKIILSSLDQIGIVWAYVQTT